jgi:hypothetical protein
MVAWGLCGLLAFWSLVGVTYHSQPLCPWVDYDKNGRSFKSHNVGALKYKTVSVWVIVTKFCLGNGCVGVKQTPLRPYAAFQCQGFFFNVLVIARGTFVRRYKGRQNLVVGVHLGKWWATTQGWVRLGLGGCNPSFFFSFFLSGSCSLFCMLATQSMSWPEKSSLSSLPYSFVTTCNKTLFTSLRLGCSWFCLLYTWVVGGHVFQLTWATWWVQGEGSATFRGRPKTQPRPSAAQLRVLSQMADARV